jgi:RNA polymerase sigma factor (TIGR02999 family)
LLAQAARGEHGAFEQVFEALYPDLRKIASARLHAHHGAADLQTTALVHESFLRLVDAARLVLEDRKHFFTYAAKTMRNIIIDFAHARRAERRGGGRTEVPLDTDLAERLPGGEADAELLRINDALLALEALDPVLAQVVEMRFFAGYDDTEIAAVLGTSDRTVRRHWDKARSFLAASMRE